MCGREQHRSGRESWTPLCPVQMISRMTESLYGRRNTEWLQDRLWSYVDRRKAILGRVDEPANHGDTGARNLFQLSGTRSHTCSCRPDVVCLGCSGAARYCGFRSQCRSLLARLCSLQNRGRQTLRDERLFLKLAQNPSEQDLVSFDTALTVSAMRYICPIHTRMRSHACVRFSSTMRRTCQNSRLH